MSTSIPETITADFVYVRGKVAGQSIDLQTEIAHIRSIAREHYVVSRVSLVCSYSISGCLLAQQAIEMYLKGIIIANGGTPRGHELIKLVGYGIMQRISGLEELSKNRDQMVLMKQLCAVYDSLRFAEDTGYFIANKNIFMFLDELVFFFEKMYADFLKQSDIKIYVHETMKNRFLKFNDYFTPEMVSNNSRTNHAGSDQETKEFPVETGSTIAVSSMVGMGLTRPIQFTFTPKRISKEERQVQGSVT
jgi:hypothetical protein